MFPLLYYAEYEKNEECYAGVKGFGTRESHRVYLVEFFSFCFCREHIRQL